MSKDRRVFLGAAVMLATLVALSQTASVEWNPQLLQEELMKRSSAAQTTKWQKWPLLSLMPRQRLYEQYESRHGQQPQGPAYSVEGDDDDVGLDSQDDSRKAKQRNKACFFKICSFSTRALKGREMNLD
ncbi:uncharacterized protein LOC135396208 [Ornithodoros turicata]|uniref:uncharacterized protein LOC135396208 n=1 Tax=Ornithodoros turicata TaxID=34597 RepID=UPI003138ED99